MPRRKQRRRGKTRVRSQVPLFTVLGETDPEFLLFGDDDDALDAHGLDLDLSALEALLADSLPPARPRRPVHADPRSFGRGRWSRAWTAALGTCGVSDARYRRGLECLFGGAVVDLQVERGSIAAEVREAHLNLVRIHVSTGRGIQKLAENLRDAHAGPRGSIGPGDLVDALLAARPALLPTPRELATVCTCPDRAPCRHAIAVLGGLGGLVDDEPGLLLELWGVRAGTWSPRDLVIMPLAPEKPALTGDLAALFAIDLVRPTSAAPLDPPQAPATGSIPPSARPEVEREHLRVLGLSTRTIDVWLREGVLRPTDRREVYERTPEANRRICDRLAR